jgi:mannose-6-phosphate isomerase-like protein (cupin superfamily)
MDKIIVPTKQDTNFTTIEMGAFADLDQYQFIRPNSNVPMEGKVFLKELLGLTSSEISLNKMPPGGGLPFYHTHKLNEEIYIFIKGRGEFQVDGKVFPVQEGSVVRIARGGERCWRNNSTEDLYCIVIQAREGRYDGSTTQDGVGVVKKVVWDGQPQA